MGPTQKSLDVRPTDIKAYGLLSPCHRPYDDILSSYRSDIPVGLVR